MTPNPFFSQSLDFSTIFGGTYRFFQLILHYSLLRYLFFYFFLFLFSTFYPSYYIPSLFSYLFISVGHLLFSCLDHVGFMGHGAYRLDASFLHQKKASGLNIVYFLSEFSCIVGLHFVL